MKSIPHQKKVKENKKIEQEDIDQDQIGNQYWLDSFGKQVQVSTPQFISKFRKFIFEYASILLDNEQLLYIQSQLDPNQRQIITYIDFLIFYDYFWKIPSKRVTVFKYHFKNIDNQKNKKEMLHCITLRFTQCPAKWAEQVFGVKKNNDKNDKTISLFKSSIQIRGKTIVTLDEGLVRVGSLVQKNDIILKEGTHTNEQQLVFNFSQYGCHVRDVAKFNRAQFKVGKTPYQLGLDMVIQLGLHTQYVVRLASPIIPVPQQGGFVQGLNFKEQNLESLVVEFEENQQQHHCRTVVEYQAFLEEKEANLLKFEQLKKKKLVLQQIKGGNVGEEVIWILDDAKKDQKFSIGRDSTMNLCIPEDFSVEMMHCEIKFSQTFGWYIEDVAGSHYGTYVNMANQSQDQTGLESNLHLLGDNMVIRFDKYCFTVNSVYSTE